MQLWNEYEGVTIDGAFPLKKLLLPEGRSAFFSTAGPKGESTVVRLIECHFDEEEILSRWRTIEALNHTNLVRLEHYGKIEVDGGPVVYAVFEKVDANLAEVLDVGHLSVKDTAQLAASLLDAVRMLHENGFVHEHLEPRNIFRVGDVVKLRSDCIREAQEGGEGRAAKQRDVRMLSTVLLQALTRRDSMDGLPDSAVPAPFNEMIRNGLAGRWGLEQMHASLTEIEPLPVTPPRPAKMDTPAPRPESLALKAAGIRSDITKDSANGTPRVEAPISAPRVTRTKETFVPSVGRLDRFDKESRRGSIGSPWSLLASVVAVLALLAVFLFARAGTRNPEASDSPFPQPTSAAAMPARSAANAVPPKASSLPGPVTGDRSTGWRVVAFTYNRKADAEKKVKALAEKHPDLNPAVFAPNGRAPYLVTVGGAMTRDNAYALARRARALGLPKDSYAQNYSSRSR